MLVQSTRFGELEVAEEGILQFPCGIPGFVEEKTFALLPYQPDSPFSFLQSLKDPSLAFMLVEPFSFFPDYDFELDDVIVKELGLSDENVPQIFNIVRVPEKIEEMTVNLLAPIIVNWQSHKAMQHVLVTTSYPVRQRVFPEGIPSRTGKGGR